MANPTAPDPGPEGVRRSRRALFALLVPGVLLASHTLPPEAARIALGLAVALELVVIAVIAAGARRLRRVLRRDASRPLLLRLGDGLEEVGLPRWLARILTTELCTVGLALTGWFRRGPRHGFSIHRTHCTLAFHVVISGLIALETLVFHLLLARVTVAGAWISTGCSIYALLWLAGDAHALRLGRIRIERDRLVLEIARRWAAVIPRETIVAARPATAVPEGAIDLALETPTVAIELSAPATVRGPFGLTRTGARLALTIDDPDGFIAALAPSMIR